MALTGRSPASVSRDRGLDALGGHVGDFLVGELRRIGSAGAAEIAAVQPLRARCASTGRTDTASAARRDRGICCKADVARDGTGCVEARMSSRCASVRSTPSPMMPWFCGVRRPDEFRRQIENANRRRTALLAALPAVRRDSLRRAGSVISSASRSGLTAWTRTVSRGGAGGATTGLAVKSKGMPRRRHIRR